MKYSDKQTERRIARLERELRGVYAMAWTDVSQTIDRYMASWAAEEKKLKDRIDSGKFTPPPGETAESYFRKWRMNHIGMGARWSKVRKNIVDRMVDANVHAAELINGAADGVYAVNRNYQAYQIEQYIPQIDIGDGRAMGVAFDLVNEKAVRHLETGKKQLLPKARVDIPKDQAWNMRKVQNELLSGILQGKSADKIARDFQRVTNMNWNAARRNARTACGAAQCAGQQANIDEAAAMGIDCMKEWMATLDDRTRDTHQDMDGVRVGVNETFPNGCRYPCDPLGEPREVYNCRCTLKTIIGGINDRRGERIAKNENGKYVYLDDVTYRGKDDSKSYAEWIENKIDGAETEEKAREYADEAEREGLKLKPRGERVIDRDGNVVNSKTGKVYKTAKNTDIERLAIDSKIAYNQVRKLDKKLDSDAIVDKLAGGDRTAGSCMSLAWAYAANRCGLDVTDYRGGDSMEFISQFRTSKAMTEFDGVVSHTNTNSNQRIAGEELLRSMKRGREYILICGYHAAVTRIGADGAEYLEMQSSHSNGFKPFGENVHGVLRDRFNAELNYFGSYRWPTQLVEINSLKRSTNFRHMMGFVHNTGKQKKGKGGHER